MLSGMDHFFHPAAKAAGRNLEGADSGWTQVEPQRDVKRSLCYLAIVLGTPVDQ